MEFGAPEAERHDLPLSARFSLIMVAPLSGFAQSGLSPILPKLSDHFGEGTESLIRLMVSGLLTAMILGALLGGPIGDRLGHLRAAIALLLLYAVAGTAGYFVDDIHVLIATRLVLGFANAALGVTAAALITTRIAPAFQEKWLGYFVVAGTFGALPLVWAAGRIAETGWRSVFLMHLLALPVLLWILASVPKGAPVSVGTAKAETRASAPIPFGIIAFGIACGAVCGTGFVFVPFHLAVIGYGSPDSVATAIIALTLFGGIASYSYGWLRTRLALAPVTGLGFLATAAGLLAFGLAETYVTALAGMALMGVGIGIVGPAMLATSAMVARPGRQARTIGLARAGFYGGPLVAQLFLEPVARHGGPGAAMIGLAVFAATMIGVIAASARFFSHQFSEA